jgi:DNA modification methylase
LGFVGLPNIIWRKQTNAPNKFMGSGMLPCGAYVTLEHEWILIFRKGGKREYKNTDAKQSRMRSSFFWEERNIWFSDIWEIKGTKQKMHKTTSRERSAAYPFEIPYRLINMFSQKGDTVLDPFLGTGTTIQAAMVLGRNSCGYEIDPNFEAIIREGIETLELDMCNSIIKQRFDAHKEFITNRKSSGKDIKHFNNTLNSDVMTTQEKEIEFNYLESIELQKENRNYIVTYEEASDLNNLPFKNSFFKVAK